MPINIALEINVAVVGSCGSKCLTQKDTVMTPAGLKTTPLNPESRPRR